MSESKISCPHCDQHILLDETWAGQTVNCPACQKPFEVPGAVAPPSAPSAPAPPPPPAAGRPAGVRINRPAASAPPPSGSPRPMAGARVPQGAAPRTSGLAITSLVLAIFGCFGLTAIGAVICGHLARKQIRNDRSLTGGGLALAGLIIGYIALVACVGFSVLVGIGMIRAKQMMKEFENAPWATNGTVTESADGFSNPAFEQSIPEAPAEAVTGNIQGDVFTYTKSSLSTNMGLLTISDGEGFMADRDVKIFLFAKPGESLENRTWNITPTTTGMKPHVHLSWQENDSRKSKALTSGYQLELSTGAINDGVITGSLNLKVTGATTAELKGNFTARIE